MRAAHGPQTGPLRRVSRLHGVPGVQKHQASSRSGDALPASGLWRHHRPAPVTTRASQFGGVPVDYGYLWWMAAIDPALPTAELGNRVLIAAGNMNQFLFVAPALDLVVVNTGATNESFGVTVDFVLRELIPAIVR